MSKDDSNRPAHPFEEVTGRAGGAITDWANYGGLTKRQYAAIHLGVPDSGSEWLDKMIRKKLSQDKIPAPPEWEKR